jgi:hypothetical protein
MRNQFFYTRKEITGGTPENPEYTERKDSFNIDAVIRSITMHDGTVLVLLNDIHERTTEQPNINVKTNKVQGTTRKRDVYQSEIYLSPEDGERLHKLTEILE